MGKRLYVGNLSYDSTEDSVRAAFSEDAPDYSSISLGFRCARDGAA